MFGRLAMVVSSVLRFAPVLPAQTKPAQPAAPASDPFLGTFSDGTGALTIRKEPKGYVGTYDYQGQSFPVTAARSGGQLIATFEANGETYLFTARPSAGGLAVLLSGQTYQLARQAASGGPPPAGPAGVLPPAVGAPGGTAADRQLAQLLLSSPWCSFSYKSGYARSSRNVFSQNGTLATSTNSEGGSVRSTRIAGHGSAPTTPTPAASRPAAATLPHSASAGSIRLPRSGRGGGPAAASGEYRLRSPED